MRTHVMKPFPTLSVRLDMFVATIRKSAVNYKKHEKMKRLWTPLRHADIFSRVLLAMSRDLQ